MGICFNNVELMQFQKLPAVLNKLHEAMSHNKSIWFERFSVSIALLLFFTDGLAVYIIGPIFPTEAAEKNVDQSLVGLISSAAAISELITSLLLIVIANPQNQKFFVISGGLISAVSTLAFGFLVYGPDGTTFAVSCAVARVVCGIGCAFTWSTSVPVLISGFPRFEKSLPNLVEMSCAFGSLLGPSCGSLFYNLGGYITPFAVAASVQGFVSILSFFLIPGYNSPRKDRSMEGTRSMGSNRYTFKDDVRKCHIDYDRLLDSIKERDTNGKNFMTSFGIVCLSLTIISCGISLGFVGVAIAPFLKNSFGVDQSSAGYYFIAYSALNVISYFPITALNQKGFGGLLFILSGVTGMIGYAGFACLYFTKGDSAVYFLVPFSLLGLVAPFMLISSYQLLEKAAKLSGLHDAPKVRLYVSIWLNICLNSGAIFGQSVIGGFVYDHVSFYHGAAIQCLGEVIAVILSCIFLIKEKLVFSAL